MNQLLDPIDALIMWINLMHHCGMDMRDDCLIFPRKDVLLEALKGNFFKTVIYKPDEAEEERRLAAEDEDDPEYSPYRFTTVDPNDVRTTNTWANTTLRKIMDTVIPGWKDQKDSKGNPKRRFGTHTAKKTGVLMYTIGGQTKTGHGGKDIWFPQLDLNEFCKVFRFCMETMNKYYMRKYSLI